jgi:hypothetical protein
MTDAAEALSRAGLDDLVAALISEGYSVIGPTMRDDAIVLAELSSGAQLRRAGAWTAHPAGTGCAAGARRARRSRQPRVGWAGRCPRWTCVTAIQLARGPRPRPAAAGRPGVEAADLGFGTGLSGPVAACLPELTRMVLAEVTAGRGG